MTRSELVRLSGISKQQLSRLENGQIRLRLDHLKPFAPHLGYTPEQMLLWGHLPGTSEERWSDRSHSGTSSSKALPGQVAELDTRVTDGAPVRETRKAGGRADLVKGESWYFPVSFVREQLHTSPELLLVVEVIGDSMAPTITSGERVIIDTGHTTPSPDGLYAIRDPFNSVVVRRLQVLRAAKPTRVKVLPDNPKHPGEEVPLGELEIVGKALCCLKLL
jgi:transcriptional regulator with XRE-family HTH domain